MTGTPVGSRTELSAHIMTFLYRHFGMESVPDPLCSLEDISSESMESVPHPLNNLYIKKVSLEDKWIICNSSCKMQTAQKKKLITDKHI